MNTERKTAEDYINLALSFLRELEGERVAGTDGEERARKVFKKYLEGSGITYTEDEFELYVSTNLKGRLIARDREIEVRPYGLSVPYKITGALLYFDHPEEALAIANDLKDKICMFAVSPRYEHTMRLKERGCKGFLFVSGAEKELTSLHLRQKAIKEGNVIPAATIRYEDAIGLLEHVGEEITVEGHGKTFKAKAHNIEVALLGKVDTNETILITGHYDTVPYSPGFSDNGAGVATMMALLRYFKENPIMRNLRFLFFSGEEWGLCGSFHYAEKHGDLLKDIVMGLNLDVGGCPVGYLMGRVTGNQGLLDMASSLLKRNGIYADLKKGIYSSDSIPFSKEGVPFVNLARIKGRATSHIHTIGDRGYYYRKEGFSSYFKASLHLIEFVGNAENLPFERSIDEDVKKQIEEYLKERV